MHPHSWKHGPAGHMGMGFGRMMGMSSRMRRGDVQPSIVALLKEKDMHGYQIIQELTERSAGSWTPSPGSIYPALQMLEDQELVTSERVGGKRVFSLTEAGREYAATLPDEAPWDDMAGDTDRTRDLRRAVATLMAATMQVGKAGSTTQIAATVGILDEARKRIYEQLAGDE